jgi:predicted nuclease with TOPRIM domain
MSNMRSNLHKKAKGGEKMNDERLKELETRLACLEDMVHKLGEKLKEIKDKLENLEIEMEDMRDDIIRLKYGR